MQRNAKSCVCDATWTGLDGMCQHVQGVSKATDVRLVSGGESVIYFGRALSFVRFHDPPKNEGRATGIPTQSCARGFHRPLRAAERCS